MKFGIASGLAALALAGLPGAPVAAGGGDALIGGVLGVMVGSALANQNGQSGGKTSRPSSGVSSGVSSVQRQQNVEMQTALNYFGFPVGTPDGSVGPKTRAAVSQYQATLGYPATGYITDFERSVLITSYQRALAGGAQVQMMAARDPMGLKGVLVAWHREMLTGQPAASGGALAGLPVEVSDSVHEIARNSNVEVEQLVQRSGFIHLADMNGDGRTDYLLDTSVTGSAFWCNATACAVRVFASTPEGHVRNDFQAFNATPAMFDCLRGSCTMKSPGTVMVAVPVAPPGPPVQPPVMAAMPQPGAPALPVPTAQTVVAGPPAPAAAPVAAPAPALPLFAAAAPAAPVMSLASHCNRISLQTATGGGYTPAAALTDADFALGEQFCLARTYAMSQGEEAAGRMAGFTAQQIADQCIGFAPFFAQPVAALGRQSRAEVVAAAAAVAGGTGMTPAQLAETARVCLGVGYTTDRMDLAIGMALLLDALGEAAYAELVGHHLAQGFGAAPQPERALEWYEAGLQAAAAGGAVFAPGLPDRLEVLRKASLAAAGRPDPAGAAARQVPAALPSFSAPASAP